MLVVDETQANIFENTILGNPQFSSHFSDFTLFRNTTSNTKSTDHSVPMILTGNFYDNSIPYSKAIDQYATASLPLDLSNRGYESDLYFLSAATTSP